MIAIYLTEEWTQVVRAGLRRGKFHIVEGEYLDSYLQDLLRLDVIQLGEMFREVQLITKSKDEDVCVILPDYVFRKIGCYNDTENLDAEIKDDLRVPIDTCSLSSPIVINKKTLQKRTICAIDRAYIDALVSASKQANMSIVSVEPAGFVFLKATRKWEREQMALFISGKTASLLSYSPLGGMFVQRLGQNLSYAKDKNNAEVLNKVIQETLVNADYVNSVTFRLTNKNVPVHILSDNFEEYFTLPSFQSRFADLPINNGMIEDIEDESDYRTFLIPITALFESYFPTGITSPKLSFMQLLPANVVPQDVSQNSRKARLRKALKKWARVALVLGVIAVGAEVAGSIYFSSIMIPDSLRNEYAVAQTKQSDVNRELERVQQKGAEDEDVLTALRSLISSKPESLGFTEVEVGQRGNADDAERTKRWVRVTAKAQDPMVVQDYISRLTANPTFNGVVIEEISSDGSKDNLVKRARLVIGRAK